MKSALEGLRVVDLSELLPGPFLTSVLADLGADVLKLERPAGDTARKTAPGIYEMLRRGKRGGMVDLKTEDGRQALHEELAAADVLVEGFRPGVLDRLGVGPAECCARHPRLVVVSISGFGQTGPLRDAPGHDNAYAAANGALSLAGDGDQPAWNPGLPVADLSSSLYGAVAVLAALRERDRSGRGGHLDVSITACLAHWLNPRLADFHAYGLDDRAAQRAYLHDRAGYGTFTSADGVPIAVAAMEDHFFTGIVEALDLANWRDPRWHEAAARRTVAADINAALRAAIGALDGEDCLARLERHGVPAHRVLDVHEALALAEPERVDTSTVPHRYAFPVVRR
ncbi:CoA transferase [Pseudonocardia kujensis]|uniref:CaiB/BaiF CoA transferase family protein n=1 Tax=Pseudonocardia kujensis TaxID=1128675 RepID=UPI001E42B4F4|nr:CoA transferase [Pseudonocardia kujensis]MCE0765046.1 CoA transferase [Pseudonocardia kujensis]